RAAAEACATPATADDGPEGADELAGVGAAVGWTGPGIPSARSSPEGPADRTTGLAGLDDSALPAGPLA
ncbi:hypothetical protein ACFQ0D_30580, partial [Micromonospora zhanjiangensis]